MLDRLQHWLGTDSEHGRHLIVIVIAVFLDMLAVSFFVPLLPFYWKQLGVRPELLGFVSSVYQLSQIVSGVVLGYVGDHILGRKGVMLMSFIGSAVSYALAATSYKAGWVWGVVLSRVIVGLVKQTMTISKAAITSMTSEEERISVLSHLRASLTFAFMIGPTIGGLISKWFDKSMPAYIAAGIFVLNSVVLYFYLPDDKEAQKAGLKEHGEGQEQATVADEKDGKGEEKGVKKEEEGKPKGRGGVLDGIWKVVSHPGLGRITCIKIINSTFVASMFALSSTSTADKYGLEPHHMGYLSTTNSLMSLLVQSFAVATVAKYLGEERALQLGIVVAVIQCLVEASTNSIYVYVALMPFRVVSSNVITQMFESLFTDLIPPEEGAAALGSLGLLKSIARVSGPLYGGLLVGYVQPYLGLNSRPFVEAGHNVIILLMLLSCYPLHAQKAANLKLKKE